MLQQLYPVGADSQPLVGTYLALNLHQRALVDHIFIYANYISSLDGRISQLASHDGAYNVPVGIANKRDWRLYQELAGQSDVMLTSARYFRQLAKGVAQDLLPVGSHPDFVDIQVWREQQGLKPQPDVMILSNSLDIPLEALAKLGQRKIIVMTHAKANLLAVKRLEDVGVQVIQAEGGVRGRFVRHTLVLMGYRSAYMIAGPQVHRTLVADGVLDEFFLTSHFSLLGGDSFHTVLEGDVTRTTMKLVSLYLDQQEGQMLMRYAYGNHCTTSVVSS